MQSKLKTTEFKLILTQGAHACTQERFQSYITRTYKDYRTFQNVIIDKYMIWVWSQFTGPGFLQIYIYLIFFLLSRENWDLGGTHVDFGGSLL